jgi:Zn-dependent protease with chaperone function
MQKFTKQDKSSFAAMKISSNKRWGIMSLFASHPSLDDRISALEKLSI